MLNTEGALIGAAAFSFAFAASRLGCPIDNRLHILVWHVLPVFVATLLSIRAGAAWLQRERASNRFAAKISRIVNLTVTSYWQIARIYSR